MSFPRSFVVTLCCGLWIPAQAAMTVAGRTYEVHVPGNASDPAPVVIVFHGGGGNAANAARMSGMNAKADQEGFIAVYPNGTGLRPAAKMLTWNAWRCCGAALDRKVDDVAFVRALVEDVASRYRVDRKRIYATGMSNGGMMAYRVACEAGDVFAAVAPVAGALNSYDCLTGPKVSVIAFHGTADPHVRFEGGIPHRMFDSHKRADNSVQFALDVWKQRDRCEGEARREASGPLIHTSFDCAEGTAVEVYAIEGWGHAWPAMATDRMWDFFRKHPKR